MKIVCATLNSKYIHSALAPWCLKAGIEKFCDFSNEVKIIESTVNAKTDSFIDNIVSFSPDILALSCYIWNISFMPEICNKIKKKLNCKIVLGGPEVAYNQKEVLNKNINVDFILSGEGEFCFPLLINALNNKKNFHQIPGLSYRENTEIIINPEAEYTATPPSPYCDEYFQNLNGRIAYIESSRGCPFRCAYCLSGRVSNLRYFEFEQIKNDLIKLSHSGTKTIKFIDRTFNADAKKANKILKFIKDEYGKILSDNVSFHFEIAADILSEETFSLIEQIPTKAVQFEIGIQSFNEDTLKMINRKTNLNKVYDNIKRLKSFNNMHIHIDLIAGLTGENFESFKNSFNLAYSLKTNMLQLGFLKLLHGADMREKTNIFPCEYNSTPPYEVVSTPWLSAYDISQLKMCENALDKLYNSGRFLFSIDYLINEEKISPFDLFFSFGKHINSQTLSLHDLTKEFYCFFNDKCNKNILREKILSDLISCGVNIKIPDELIQYDPNYKQLKKYYTEFFKENIKLVILNSKKQVYIIRESSKKDIFGRIIGEYYDITSTI